MFAFLLTVRIIFIAFFMFAGIMHIVKPKLFKHFIPKPFPKLLVNYVVGVIEFALGAGLIFLATAKYAALGIIILLILFLPIHIWDVTRERPAIGSKMLAFVRIPLQFVFIFLAYLIYTNPDLFKILNS